MGNRTERKMLILATVQYFSWYRRERRTQWSVNHFLKEQIAMSFKIGQVFGLVSFTVSLKAMGFEYP